MTWLKRAAMLIALIAIAGFASADQWNDRTKITIDQQMMVPGTTLDPGTYIFKLADSKANRQLVQIWNADETRLITTTNAVPTRRENISGDLVLKVNPTTAGTNAVAAIKAWYYPGTRYGHEFIYPDRQARDIAQRTRTLVLSADTADGDMKGTIYTYDASGTKGAWQRDDQMMQEWNTWHEGHRTASARVASPGGESAQATTPIVRSQPNATRVAIGDLEEHPDKYVGQTIAVTAEVDDVFGPRLFKIDEPNWADFDGEVLVYMPTSLAALVRKDDRVTVTGTMKAFMRSDFEPELGWLDASSDIAAEFARRPVLFADRIVGGNDNVVLSINLNEPNDKAVGTSGSTANSREGEITDLSTLAKGDRDLIGRSVNIDNVTIAQTGSHQGFWIASGGTNVFVLPANGASAPSGSAQRASGQSVSFDGMVLQMPRGLHDQSTSVHNANDQIYIYATSVK